VRRIQDSFERSPRKSTRIASRELGIPHPSVWACVEAPFTVQLSPYFNILLVLVIQCRIVCLPVCCFTD